MSYYKTVKQIKEMKPGKRRSYELFKLLQKTVLNKFQKDFNNLTEVARDQWNKENLERLYKFNRLQYACYPHEDSEYDNRMQLWRESEATI